MTNIVSEIQTLGNTEDIKLSILREDKIHPYISGNKYRKLKYNLIEYSKDDYNALLTFGGAYSNHISAAAAAGKEFGIPVIGVIRGDELENKINENPTLSFASECGMKFKFVSRSEYRKKDEPEFSEKLKSEFGNIFILPEGGTNESAVRGCEEILGLHTSEYDYICCPVGTAGTISGIIRSSLAHQKVLGFPALKDSNFLNDKIKNFTNRSNFELINDWHFGGFAKVSEELIDFINGFFIKYNISLDPIYTGKMMFGLFKMIENGYFDKGSKILAVHTGGLQGIEGMNQKIIRKFDKKIIS